ncbi:uncharacterized protein STEHIDRAFT_140876 [Stereum hirsutum FP-91666 SS1]|uniref:uncharacterized protein n=1 Tax=Stereum hirsutum (strain FP-91666) TaxID=721885 RepID=UPI000444A28B|nr:uncharacterized protein STEHIDRAFT_140876 [Stereum hirsutum FP-91666 SS1]EIM83872.1 hypothetical protein STEHIDRAFT_140876 [Stereum hirsutum FP-91666 SS1]
MSTEEVTQVQDAAAPFNDHNAEVILRTSDNVDFYVYKVILSMASPGFKTMFALPQPLSPQTAPVSAMVSGISTEEPEHKHGVPVIPVAEDARTLDPLLRACYPGLGPNVTSLDDVTRILLASEKYEIKAFHRLAEFILKEHIDTDLVRVYAIACRFGLETIKSSAQESSVGKDKVELLRAEPDELKLLTVEQYRDLVAYDPRKKRLASRATQMRNRKFFE